MGVQFVKFDTGMESFKPVFDYRARSPFNTRYTYGRESSRGLGLLT